MDDLPPMPPLQRQAQVPFIPLSDLHLGHEIRRVRVRASRVWQHRDGPGDREIQELRMVLVDDTGDSIYVVLPCRLLYFGVDVIQETKIYDLAMFEVSDQQQPTKLVENPYVLRLEEFTVI